MHGRTFRDSIRYLRNEFFRRLFGPGASSDVAFLAMTATMSADLLGDFSDLTHVDWTDQCHQMWASARDFRQRDIKMELQTTGEITQHALRRVVELLASDDVAHVCIFVNFVAEAERWASALEKLLAEERLPAAVITINGDMDKHEKFAFIRLFCSRVRLGGFSPRCLVATAAANTGIDQPKCTMVLRLGLPRTIVELLQERGRLRGRGLFAVFLDWSMAAKLMVSILTPSRSSSAEICEVDYINSTITAKSPESRRRRAWGKDVGI